MSPRQAASIGLRARTARAIAVVLAGSADSPRFVLREEIDLSDPAVPATRQPHHEVMELPWSEAVIAARPVIEAIQRVATAALGRLIRNLEAQSLRVVAAGVVGSADRPLDGIGNPHIRAHAAEGILFRQVLEIAAEANRLRSMAFAPGPALKARTEEIRTQLTALGRAAGAPWRGDEKEAATAAWIALAARNR